MSRRSAFLLSVALMLSLITGSSSIVFAIEKKRGRRDSNAQPSDRQSDALAN